MTTTITGESETLSGQVAAEIRAWMGRLQLRQSHLARQLGENDEWASKRLRGIIPIDLNDLQRFADALGVGVVDLLPASARASRIHSITISPRDGRARARPGEHRPASYPTGPAAQRPGSSTRTRRIQQQHGI